VTAGKYRAEVKIIKDNQTFIDASDNYFTIVASTTCVPNWSCGNWSACTNSSQTRNCVDLNNCVTTTNKPTTTQSCSVTPKCSANYDCGIDGYSGDLFCVTGMENNKTYKNYLTYTCKNPGTTSAVCVTTTQAKLQETCVTGQICQDGQCVEQTCVSEWDCTDWGACNAQLKKTRTCTDVNNCGSTISKPAETQMCCTDTDNGLNYSVYGKATNAIGVYADYCVGDILKERWCSDGEVKTDSYTCPSGQCASGACKVGLVDSNVSQGTLASLFDAIARIAQQIQDLLAK